ncbi:aminotransferase class I/II-fold pyridoxal phosphate-dependent enzyme [Catenuloplanes japonicus]|uniref:aminotransferase class I/II-fold pyridoxal phosphate-dependent enzyme n=1 Tax=Catenuloplanes japonicus TaxID=33876 RepID=UPI000A10A351|nr:aminotransferase class I/II-fold pyridoxal phosphate-dependent enzyme [Catenuloplanes japonicus]
MDDYLYFAGRALDGMAAIVATLGDDLANTRPYPGANSPYALLTHCVGVADFWSGALVAGRTVSRDRDAEFTAAGPVAPLLADVDALRERLRQDLEDLDESAPLHAAPPAAYQGPDRALTRGGALLHVLEELTQHHGQMETLRDLITGDPRTDEQRLRAGHGVKWGSLPPGTLGAWVADMDFPLAPAIRERLGAVADLGYPHWPQGDPAISAFEERMIDRYGWSPQPRRTRVFTDLIQILQVVIEHATEPGDAIAIHVPTYPPFLAAIARAGRRIVPLTVGGDLAALHDCALLVLVNPQNPTGHVFTRAELAAFAEFDLTVLADEIHADLTFAPHTHIPFATVRPERTITATSATKAFNIAGVRCALAHIGDDRLHARLAAMPLDYFGQPGVHGLVATTAAWRESDLWLGGLLDRLTRNRALVGEWVATLPWDAHYREPQATYLAWIDCAGSPFGPDPAGYLERHAGVKVSAGAEFSQHTTVDTGSWIRINFATGTDTLTEILRRISAAV